MATCRSGIKRKQSTPAVEETARAQYKLVVAGHVDHGKSTIIGRLLADTKSLPLGKLEQVKEQCERNGKQFEYAFLLDALADEQAQGITIDVARVFFSTPRRDYLILDAPGHIEFLRNMVTGASQAHGALLVIDAEEGVQDNARRHGYLLSLLGVKDVVVLINKMDLAGYNEEAFTEVREEYSGFLASVGIQPRCFVPVSGLKGDAIVSPSVNMPWYHGETVLEVLDQLEEVHTDDTLPFRMYVQDVYKFTKFGDTRRIVAGTVSSGRAQIGDQVVFYPSGKKSAVKAIEAFNAPPKTSVCAGEAAGFTLAEQAYLTRGELAVLDGQKLPQITTRFEAAMFWLGAEPMVKFKTYTLKIGTAQATVRLEKVLKVIDASTLRVLDEAQDVGQNMVAECMLKLNKAIAFDTLAQGPAMSRYVIIDGYRIAGGGCIREALGDSFASERGRVQQRNIKWIESLIAPEDRAGKYSQKPTLILITGEQKADRKDLSKALEARLFAEGRIVYFLGIGNILHGLDADIEGRDDIGQEHIRRLAELANIILGAGLLFIVSAADLTQRDLELVDELVGSERVKTIWIGASVTTDIVCDLHLTEVDALEGNLQAIEKMLQRDRVIFKP
jgi:bifunctional enzyme CysN/CysC